MVTPPGLDVTRIVEGSLTGGQIDGTALRFDEGSYQMTYTYQVSETKTEMFTVRHTHEYGRWTVITKPQVDQEGLREHVCSVCGHVEQEAIPDLSQEQHPVRLVFLGKKPIELTLESGESVQAPKAGGLLDKDLYWQNWDGALTVASRGQISYAQLVDLLGGYVPKNCWVTFQMVKAQEVERTVTVRFTDGQKQVGEAQLTLTADVKKLTEAQVKELLPEGYELTAAKDFAIRDGAVEVTVQRQVSEDAIRVTFKLRGMGRLEGQKGKTLTVVLEPGESVTAPRSTGMFRKVREVNWTLEDFQVKSGGEVSYEALAELLGGTMPTKAQVTITGKVIK